jgi:hypothetical protein
MYLWVAERVAVARPRCVRRTPTINHHGPGASRIILAIATARLLYRLTRDAIDSRQP